MIYKTAVLVAALALTALASSEAQAQRTRATADVWFHVSMTGTDAGDCMAAPCRTGQYAYELAMRDWDFAGHLAYIKYAPGQGHRGIRAAGVPVGTYLIHVVGQQSSDAAQSCSLSQAEQVGVEGASGENIFVAEDLAILIIRCLVLRAECIDSPCTRRATGVNGVTCRQTPVVDVAHVVFDVLTTGISSSQACGEINLGGNIWIGNSMGVFMQAVGLSQINGSAPIIVRNPVNVTYFALSYEGARVYLGHPIQNMAWLGTAQSLVYRGGALITNGIALPTPCLQADPAQPGYCW